jgi:hypothetical protein
VVCLYMRSQEFTLLLPPKEKKSSHAIDPVNPNCEKFSFWILLMSIFKILVKAYSILNYE